MKKLLIIICILVSISTFSQSKDTTKRVDTKAQGWPAKSDTVTIAASTNAKFVKMGNEVFALKKINAGAIALEFSEEGIQVLYQLLELSTGAHTDVEAMKKIILEQFNAQLKKTDRK